MEAIVLGMLALAAGGWASGDPRLAQGRLVYREACAACHGDDGRGNPAWESRVPAPNLATGASTAERADHWQAIVAKGGRAFGLASEMPAYGETLTREEIASAVAYLRSLCRSADRYPPGELNPRRLLATPKAFPENEVGVQASHALNRTSDTLLHARLEGRFGPRLGYGLSLPIRPEDTAFDEFAGVGNVSAELSAVVAFSPKRGRIASLGLEAEAPTGSLPRNLGTKTWVWKPSAAIGQAWGDGRTAAQAALVAELPAELRRQDRQLLYLFGISRSLGAPKTSWVPALELSGVVNRRRHFWRHELLVEISRPLNRLGHVVAAAGVRTPLGRSFGPTRLEGHVLWDFSEGRPWRGFSRSFRSTLSR
jgi:mono/diheme cytochrome c family protein